MFVEFNSLPDSSRVWVYQAERRMSEVERDSIIKILSSFAQQWEAHGQQLKCSFKIEYDQFIILAADESYHAASGCSIDDSVHVFKEIDQHFCLNLFDRTKVAFLKDNQVTVLPMTGLSKALELGIWNQSTLVFNNVVSNKGELKTIWLAPTAATWLKRYLTKLTV